MDLPLAALDAPGSDLSVLMSPSKILDPNFRIRLLLDEVPPDYDEYPDKHYQKISTQENTVSPETIPSVPEENTEVPTVLYKRTMSQNLNIAEECIPENQNSSPENQISSPENIPPLPQRLVNNRIIMIETTTKPEEKSPPPLPSKPELNHPTPEIPPLPERNIKPKFEVQSPPQINPLENTEVMKEEISEQNPNPQVLEVQSLEEDNQTQEQIV